MDDIRKQYRENLATLEQKAQDDYDKTILTLSGGALGITIAFIKDIVGNDPVINSNLIFYAWLLWGISISAILLSFYFSILAMRKAIDQIDEGANNIKKPGGWFDSVTGILNAVGGLFFIAGVILAAIFIRQNI